MSKTYTASDVDILRHGDDFVNNCLEHYGVLGMKWGVRRYQPYPAGKNGKFIGDKGPEMKYKSPSAWAFKQDLKSTFAPYGLALLPGGLAVLTYKVIADYRKTHDKTDYIEKDGPVESYKNMRKKTIETTTEQDAKMINPKKGAMGRIYNCTYCTAAMEMRRRGFDVEARRASEGNTSQIWSDWFAGAKVQQTHIERQKGESRKEWTQKNYKNLCDKLEKFPNGARGYLGLTWDQKVDSVGSGHALFWEVENGSVNFYDGQSGKKNDMLDFSLSNQVYRFARLDNCKFKNANQAVVSRKEKQK